MSARYFAMISMVLAASSCTRMEQYFPNGIKTVVDGEEYIVLKNGENNYQAVPNDPSRYNTWLPDARAAAGNVRAIEQATGCKVIRESIQNRDINTSAAVSC